jgi:hypothetical protein
MVLYKRNILQEIYSICYFTKTKYGSVNSLCSRQHYVGSDLRREILVRSLFEIRVYRLCEQTRSICFQIAPPNTGNTLHRTKSICKISEHGNSIC